MRRRLFLAACVAVIAGVGVLAEQITPRGAAAGPAVWGAITGTLSDQSDLQEALDAKGTSNFDGAYDSLTGKPALFSGAYADLTGKPTLGTAAATASTDYATSAQGVKADSALQPAGNGGSLTGLTKAQVGLGNVDNTSDANKPVSIATQTALNAKQATLVSGTNIKTVNGTALLGSGDVTISGSAAWGSVTGTLGDQTDLQTALDGKQAAGTYATGTGSASGTNTGDQASIVGITGTLAQFNTALTGADFTTGGGTASGTNTGDQSTITGNAGSATVLQNARTINGVSFNGSANITVTAAGSTLSDNVPVSKLNSGTNASATTFWRGDGAWATPAGGGSTDTVLRLAGNVSTGANTTLVDLTGMSFTADAGGIYSIEVRGIVNNAAATTGYGIGINCAQTPVTVALGGASQLANTGTVTSWSAIANNAIIGVTSGIPANATNVPVHGGGILVAHATVAGTCIFRLRSETTAAATMMANSLFIVRKVN